MLKLKVNLWTGRFRGLNSFLWQNTLKKNTIKKKAEML